MVDKLFVEWDTSMNVFKDDNNGFKYGLFESIDHHGTCDYVEWFKTKKELLQCVKDNEMILIN